MNLFAAIRQKLCRAGGLMVAVLVDEQHLVAGLELIGEDLHGGHDLRRTVFAGKRRGFRGRAGGDHHHIRPFFEHHLCGGLDAQPDVQFELVQLAHQPAGDAGDLLAPGRFSGKQILTADLFALFQQDDAMFSQSGRPGHFKAGGSRAHHHDLFGGFGGLESADAKGFFFAGGRVVKASQTVAETHAGNAPLIAGDAVPDVVRPAFHGFVGQLRITDQSPHHADHIGLAVFQDLLRQMRVVDSVGAEYRQVDHRPHAGGQGHRIRQRCVHGALDQIQIVEGAQTEVQKVELTGRLKSHGHLLGIFMGEPAAGMHLIGIESNPEGKIGPNRLADRIDGLEDETATVLHASTVGVLPVIGQGR